MPAMQIYLDYSATTPPRPEVIETVQAVMTEQWGNPSSLHQWGNRAATLLERARMQVADLLNAPIDSVVFTAGGTEADNLAILGVARRYSTPRHLIMSSVEHSAIEQPARQLEMEGWQVTRLPVDELGRVNPVDLRAALQDNTVLVSIIYGQSEVGTLQPIEALGQITRDHGALFHTDAVQVAGRLPIDVQTLPVDFLSLSSHKIYGPQGAGALYVRPGVDLLPLVSGGGQEFALRSGTQAIPNIAGFGGGGGTGGPGDGDGNPAADWAARSHLPTTSHPSPTSLPRGICATACPTTPAFTLPTRRRRNRSAAKPWCGR